MAATYSFQAKAASRGYHVFKETTWANAAVGDRVVVDIETNQDSTGKDPCGCPIKINELVVGHIPREISRHVYFFIRSENGVVKGHALSTTYRPSTIPPGGLEIPLLPTFSCSRFVTFQKMKEFVTTYNYEYSGNTSDNMSHDDEDEEDDIEFNIMQMVWVPEEEGENADDDDNGAIVAVRKKKHVIIESDSDEDEPAYQ